MTAEALAKALGGHKAGGGWRACCPAHDDREPSLSITTSGEGKVLVRCHAGCSQRAVIGVLRMRGLWRDSGTHRLPGAVRRLDPGIRGTRSVADRTRAALDIWRASRPATGTPVEAYLRARGLTQPLPPALRFHLLKHPSGGTWPAMIGLVTRGPDDTPIAIHRTFLSHDGSGKASVVPAKMMLGPCRGGAVRLGALGNLLMVGEGIETCLAAMQATPHPAWAALSTSGLRALELPGAIRDVIVLADGDSPGEAAARDCALRWQREGRHVRIARPPRGLDFNDVLLGRAPHVEEDAA